MLKSIHILLLAAALALVTSATMADWETGGDGYKPPPPKEKESYGTTVGKKVGSAFSNIVFGFLEVPKNIVNTTNDINLAAGLTLGVAKGALHMGGRAIVGLVDLVSFPAPTEPLTTPQFVWMHFPQETRYNPAFKLKK